LDGNTVTDTVNVHVAVLFRASLAVYVTVVTPIGNAALGACVLVIVGALVQLSVAVGAVHVAVAVVPVVVKEIFTGQALNTGAVVSDRHGLVTVTVKRHVTLLFLASVAVYITFVVPTGKAAPELWVLDRVGVVVQLSVTVGATQVATAVVVAVVKEILAGQLLKTGGSVSVKQGLTTVTVKRHVAVLFVASLAVYTTLVVPNGNTAPGLWVVLKSISSKSVQLSEAVGAIQVTVAVVLNVFCVKLPGQFENTGAMVSLAQGFDTVTVKRHIAVLLAISFAV
jgi:hypothetical protein